MLKYNLFFSIVICNCLSLIAQVHKIYSEDTTYTQSYFRREAAADSFNYYDGAPMNDLKNKLPDGTWILYHISEKDSDRKDINSYIEIEGHYKNMLREGAFDYYYVDNFSKKKASHTRTYRYNYKKGKLEGYFTYTYIDKAGFERKGEEGFYSNGRKNGFFIHYDNYGRIDEMNLYRNDTLCEWAEYFNDGLLHSGVGKLGYGQWSLWDTAGRILYWGNFRNDSLIEYKQYKNAQLIKNGAGKFKDYHTKYKYNFMYDTIPTNGTLKYYNEKGDLLKIEQYKNSQIEK